MRQNLPPCVEGVVERAVVRWAEARAIEHTKLNLMGNRSWPDRCFWLAGGRPLLMEFKRLGQRPRKQQQAKIELLKRLGYDVHCIDRKEEGIHILQDAILKIIFKTISPNNQEPFRSAAAACKANPHNYGWILPGVHRKLGKAKSKHAGGSRSARNVAT